MAPDAVVCLIVEDACFDVSGEWEGRENVHEPLPMILKRIRDSWSVRSGSLSASRNMEWNCRLLRWTVPRRSMRVRYSCVDRMRCSRAIPTAWVY